MRGKLLGIKKSTLLKCYALINCIIYLVIFALSLTILEYPNLWFYALIGVIGLQLVEKSILLKIDSNLYFGSLLLFSSLFHIYCFCFDILSIYPAFVVLAFGIASLFTAYFYRQGFHYYIAFWLFVISSATFIFILNYISLIIFLAIVIGCVLLLLLGLIFVR